MADLPLTVTRRAEARIPTEWGGVSVFLYEDDREHRNTWLWYGRGRPAGPDVLVRVHSECFTGDVLGSRRCDCGEQFTLAMRMIAEAGAECSSTCARKAGASACGKAAGL